MNLPELLQSRGFTSALIVDDAFDDVPMAADLEMDAEAWSIFIADIGADVDHVLAVFPEYAGMDAHDLRRSDKFVAAMWALREKVRPDLWNRLFETYERDTTADRRFLQRLGERLSAAGLNVVSAGRTLPETASECDIVFADLFLGAAQQDFDVEQSIRRLRDLLAGRESAPPPVVLMSRSPLLKDKKERFRDDAEMLGALFRVYQKNDLLEGSTVEMTLERLATHYADAIRVAAFVFAWQAGLKRATVDFMKLIRRLDLSDYCQIRDVLLDFEGQPLGSYLLDVFDRVLQHEIEGQPLTIEAAQELNKIDPIDYPTPYIAGTPDLQNLVFRSIWQNPERLKVTGNSAGIAVSFGDVLVRRARLQGGDVAGAPDEPEALIVLTPACDLVRKPGNRRVLLMGGLLKAIDHKTWTYKTAAASTPILIIENQPRMSITWNLEDLRMLKHAEVATLVAPEGPYSIAVRLRESNAIELQQRMLADMGRIGLISTMPFTFPVKVSLFTAEVDAKLKELELPVTTKDGGVCITGRDEEGADLTRLILTEASVDEIANAVGKLDEAQVHPRSRETLKRLQASASFRSLLQRGLKAPMATARGNLALLKVPGEKKNGEEQSSEEIVGLVTRNPGPLNTLSGSQLKHGALVVVIRDLEPHPVLIEETGEGL